MAHTSLVKAMNRITSLEAQQSQVKFKKLCIAVSLSFSIILLYQYNFFHTCSSNTRPTIIIFLQKKTTFMIPSKETVELLAQNSGGDIRTAINGLQFSCLKG